MYLDFLVLFSYPSFHQKSIFPELSFSWSLAKMSKTVHIGYSVQFFGISTQGNIQPAGHSEISPLSRPNGDNMMNQSIMFIIATIIKTLLLSLFLSTNFFFRCVSWIVSLKSISQMCLCRQLAQGCDISSHTRSCNLIPHLMTLGTGSPLDPQRFATRMTHYPTWW